MVVGWGGGWGGGHGIGDEPRRLGNVLAGVERYEYVLAEF